MSVAIWVEWDQAHRRWWQPPRRKRLVVSPEAARWIIENYIEAQEPWT